VRCLTRRPGIGRGLPAVQPSRRSSRTRHPAGSTPSVSRPARGGHGHKRIGGHFWGGAGRTTGKGRDADSVVAAGGKLTSALVAPVDGLKFRNLRVMAKVGGAQMRSELERAEDDNATLYCVNRTARALCASKK
jgi:hypothetical protein